MPDIDLPKSDPVISASEIPAPSAAAAAAASGGEEPVVEREEGEMDADPNSTSEDIEEMKRRLKEIEEEAAALRKMRAKVEKEMAAAVAAQYPTAVSEALAAKEEADSRSIFVGNVDYACTPEEVQQLFQSCGTVNRVTILTDKFGQPKGFAYVEFMEVDAVQNALLLNESELHGRQLKVSAKRTNIPGMKQYRAQRSFQSQAAYMPSPYGFGKTPRFRRQMQFQPYF